MTPKEKANELFDRYVQSSVIIEDDEKFYHEKPFSLAKQCALVTVDEIIQELTPYLEARASYYKQVKEEIINL